jgi:flagellar biosynthetic protein FliP
MSTATLSRPRLARAAARFLLHLLEMTLAMMVGMVIFGALVGGIAAAAGSSLDGVRVGQPAPFVLGMALSMSATMVAWMRRRGHGWRACGEMTAAMFVPAVLLIGCYWAGTVTADSVCGLACALMIPAMAVAMLFRLDAHTTHSSRAAPG